MQREQGRCQHHDTEAGDRERRAVAIKHLMNPLLLCYTEDVQSLLCCLPCGEESRDAEFACVLSAPHLVCGGLGKRLCRQPHLSQISPAPNFQDTTVPQGLAPVRLYGRQQSPAVHRQTFQRHVTPQLNTRSHCEDLPARI